jgi:hypothetical protein
MTSSIRTIIVDASVALSTASRLTAAGSRTPYSMGSESCDFRLLYSTPLAGIHSSTSVGLCCLTINSIVDESKSVVTVHSSHWSG